MQWVQNRALQPQMASPAASQGQSDATLSLRLLRPEPRRRPWPLFMSRPPYPIRPRILFLAPEHDLPGLSRRQPFLSGIPETAPQKAHWLHPRPPAPPNRADRAIPEKPQSSARSLPPSPVSLGEEARSLQSHEAPVTALRPSSELSNQALSRPLHPPAHL